MPPSAPPATTATAARMDRALTIGVAVICATLIGFKFVLAARLNVNWDEFRFLSFVHAAARGEHRLLMQGAYVHLFGWLPDLGDDEMTRIFAARLAMTALLCVTAALVWALGRRWLRGSTAMIPPFVYLMAVPVMTHGGSFRADSLLAPLLMAALVLLTGPEPRTGRDSSAGALLGAAFAISVKAVLFAPLLATLLLCREQGSAPRTADRRRGDLTAALRVAGVACITAAALIFLHSLTISSAPSEAVTAFGARTAKRTLLDVSWFAQLGYLHSYVRWQPLPWLLMTLGTIAALLRREFDIASLALALLPIAVYRNSFPYFYVVMLAPASVLAGVAVRELKVVLSERSTESRSIALVTLVWAGLLYQGLTGLGRLTHDGQSDQRKVVSAVHAIFPAPVTYVDRCGMISSFRKAGFFMSTWGMENYRDRNAPFMPAVLRNAKPAFVLVNSPLLDPSLAPKGGLLPEDYEIIERFYLPYWGPIRVAGAQVRLHGSISERVVVPYPAEYRVDAAKPVLADGVLRQPGETIHVPGDAIAVQAAGPTGVDEELIVRLLLAAAQPPPPDELQSVALFEGL